jgi:hypothetical protein
MNEVWDYFAVFGLHFAQILTEYLAFKSLGWRIRNTLTDLYRQSRKGTLDVDVTA